MYTLQQNKPRMTYSIHSKSQLQYQNLQTPKIKRNVKSYFMDLVLSCQLSKIFNYKHHYKHQYYYYKD
jgi:hypothetical protein